MVMCTGPAAIITKRNNAEIFGPGRAVIIAQSIIKASHRPGLWAHWLLLAVFSLLMPLATANAQTSQAVTAQPLAELLIERQLRAPARIVPNNQSVISSEVSATVQTIQADVGLAIKAGDTLLQLDPVDYQLAADLAAANLNASSARIRQAELRLARARELIKQQYVSDDDLLARETDLAVLKAEYKALQVQHRIARRNLAKCTILAPFNGVVSKRFANVGALANPGTVLLTVVETGSVEVEAEVPSQHIETLATARDLRFMGAQSTAEVAVARVTAVIGESNRNQLVRLTPQSDGLLPGDSGELIWLAARGLLPAIMVVNRDGKLGVFVVEGEAARFIELPGAQEGRPVRVVLPDDSRIIVRGRERVSDGDRVSVNPP